MVLQECVLQRKDPSPKMDCRNDSKEEGVGRVLGANWVCVCVWREAIQIDKTNFKMCKMQIDCDIEWLHKAHTACGVSLSTANTACVRKQLLVGC